MISIHIWAVFIAFMTIVGLYRLWQDTYEDWFYKTLMTTLVLILSVVIAVLPYALHASISSPNLATLKKSDWYCEASHKEQTYTGKIWVTRNVCDIYVRKEMVQ